MSKIKRTLAVLLSAVMILGMLPVMTSAATGESTDAIIMSKSYDQESGKLTLEAYVTGESQVIETVQPIDVVLVLDVSGSMDDPFGTDVTSYEKTYNVSQWSLERYYYQDEDGNFNRAYYCYNEKSWYTESHFHFWFINIGGGEKLTPKTSSDSEGTQFYTRTTTSITKIEALKDAAKSFIDLVSTTSPDSNIAIVKFAGDTTNVVGNDKYHDSDDDEYYNYSQTVMGLTSADTNSDTLKNKINSLEAAGATRADYGMTHAKTILDSADNEGHAKVVVMFTDGSPTSYNRFENEVANSAISTSSAMKADDVTVYTIGCFNNADSSRVSDETAWSNLSNVNKYMNLVSSNFDSNATGMDADFDNYTYGGYYKTASNANELESVFEAISEDIGSANYQLSKTTVLKDIITDEFKLPSGASDISAYSVSFNGYSNGVATWNNDRLSLTPTYDENSKTISVTGFDYSENWVGTDSNGPRGRKLVVEITIQPEKELYGVYPTNKSDSGLYVDGKLVKPFEIPEATYPYYIVNHVRKDSTVTEPVRYSGNDETCSMTARVDTDKYLYGGTFNDAGCTTAYPFKTGETGLEFKLEKFDNDNIQTFYVREVSKSYLVPKNICTSNKVLDSETNTWKDSVAHFYLITAIDDTCYKSVGFDVNKQKKDADEISIINSTNVKNAGEDGSSLGDSTTVVYDQIDVLLKNGTSVPYTASSFYTLSGKLACNEVAQSDWKDEGCLISITPYWITLDNVKVTGCRTRTCEYKGLGNDRLPITEEVEINSRMSAYNPVTPLMSINAVSLLSLRNYEPDEETPDIPVVTEDTISVIVHDGDNTKTFEIEKGDDVEITPDGSLFAGWFTDSSCTKPAELTDIQSDIEIWAKYVSDDYLCTKYIEQGWFRVYGMTLITALDSDNYTDAGFVINGKKISCDYSESYGAFTARALFGSNIARGAKLMTYSLSLRAASNGDKFEVTPYWVTLDGTIVYGTSRTFTYNMRGIIG